MDINFAAANMTGYNNPEIAVLTLAIDGTSTPISYPSFNDILTLLRSGQVPLLLLKDESTQTGTLLQLAYYSLADQVISFVSIFAMSDKAGLVVIANFLRDSPPVLKNLPIQFSV